MQLSETTAHKQRWQRCHDQKLQKRFVRVAPAAPHHVDASVQRRIPDEFQPAWCVDDATHTVAIWITGEDGIFPCSLKAGGWETVMRLQRECCS